MKKISVLMGVYNCEKYLNEAIDSIINQTYTNWELIVCDDGSTDDTLAIALQYSYEDSRIIILKNDTNRGLNYTLNKCLQQATGEYVARMDGDDICSSNRFETELNFLEEHKEFDIVSTNMSFFDDGGEFRKTKGGGEIVARQFPKGTPICHAPCMVRKEAFMAVGGYSEKETRNRVEDYDLWVRMYEKGYKAYVIPECLYKMRDDRAARKRKKFRYRINESLVSVSSIIKLKLPFAYIVYSVRPILIGILPMPVYEKLHRYRNNKSL